MAALFQSFRGSGMPKRLLRYALSRLDLLDAEALDMENLDLALGRTTVFEFRDVGIKLKVRTSSCLTKAVSLLLATAANP
jgi:autophagy-related protein 2